MPPDLTDSEENCLKGMGMDPGRASGEGFFRSGQTVNSYPGDQGSWSAHRRERKHKLWPKRKKILEHSIWSIMDTLIFVR